MKGIWYSSNGKGCEHWFAYTVRANGEGWEAISRCGNATALPSLLKSKFDWRKAHPEAPCIEGRHCRTCERGKIVDKNWVKTQEEEKREGVKMKVTVTFNFDTQERKALAVHRGKETLLEPADLRQWVEMTIRAALDDIIYEVAKRND